MMFGGCRKYSEVVFVFLQEGRWVYEAKNTDVYI